jgi:branched-subunit amino acid aminotransferase/4-amino-4-deoxychorismate lyase
MYDRVVLNGEVCALADVRLRDFVDGFMFGSGLFETLRVEHGVPQFLDRHLRRLRGSLAALAPVVKPIAPNRLTDEAVRHTIAIGLAALELAERPACVAKIVVSDQNVLVTFRDLPSNQQALSRGVAIDELDETSYRAGDPLRNHKTLAYLGNYRLMSRGLLFVNERREICEAPTANAFFAIDDEIVTPPLSAPCLPGIVREMVIESGHLAGRPIRERPLRVDDLKHATAGVLTNSVSVGLAVSHLLGRALGESLALAQAVRDLCAGAADVAPVQPGASLP